ALPTERNRSMKALVVIPTYNERESVIEVLDRVLAADPRVDVLVVDDSSPDGTAALVEAKTAAEPRVHLLRRAAKQGLGGAYRREVLQAVQVGEVQSNGYCFQVEMAHRAWQEGFRVAEVPITFTERAAGVSKMSKRIVAEALWRVAVWSLTGGRRRHRQRHP